MSYCLQEPPMKKPKGETKAVEIPTNHNKMKFLKDCIARIQNSTNNLEPILDSAYFQAVPECKVIIATISNPKDISKVILRVNECLPLKQLTHLKRVLKKEIIICTLDDLNGGSVEELIKISAEDILELLKDFKEISVPCRSPKVRQQFVSCNKIWPCNFHPNNYYEKLVSGDFFDHKQLLMHKKYMELAFDVAGFVNINDFIGDCANAAVVVDPTINSIVAFCSENKIQHPLKHAAMIAIDNVAKTQNGGAWLSDQKSDNLTNNNSDLVLNGFDFNLYEELKKVHPSVNFGAKKFRSKRLMAEEGMSANECGPYLCTGYDIYLVKEPCYMCSMALVHARVKRIFFALDNCQKGALKSKMKMQTNKCLNHHFEVFSGFL